MIRPTTRRLAALSVGLLLVAILPIIVLAAQSQTLAIGAAAPGFSLSGVDEMIYTLADFAEASVNVRSQRITAWVNSTIGRGWLRTYRFGELVGLAGKPCGTRLGMS